jgi:hypothetical protein
MQRWFINTNKLASNEVLLHVLLCKLQKKYYNLVVQNGRVYFGFIALKKGNKSLRFSWNWMKREERITASMIN